MALSAREWKQSLFAKSIHTASAFWQSIGQECRSMKTSKNSTPNADRQMSFAADFPVSPSPRLLEAAKSRRIYGPKCEELSATSDPFGSLLRTSIASTMNIPRSNWRSLISKSGRLRWTLHHAADDMNAAGLSLWPTPTRTANHDAPSMRKWPSHKAVQDEAGGTTPRLWEWMMDFPIGWTE